MEWRAWHIFVDDFRALDELLDDVIRPSVADLARRQAMSSWFFLRYWENGPHIRLRLLRPDRDAFDALGEHLRAKVTALMANSPPAKESFLAGTRVDGWHTNPAALPVFAPGTVCEIIYEPEYRRYGGIDGLAVNEGWFTGASQIALRLVHSTRNEWAKRETVALLLTAVTIAHLVQERADLAAFLRQMADGWGGFIPDASAIDEMAEEAYRKSSSILDPLYVAMLSGSEDVVRKHPLLMPYAKLVAERLELLQGLAREGRLVSPLTGIAPRNGEETRDALASIASSQIHMTNNRLGLSPANEYKFARMLLCAHQTEAAAD